MVPPLIATSVLQTLSAQQTEQVKLRVCGTLSFIVNTNSNTTYFRDAPLLARYRAELWLDARHDSATPGTSMVEVDLSTFTRSVPLSTYEDYRPYISRFMENPGLQSSVSSLLAPGLPTFIAASSGTSRSIAKYFPKYAHLKSMDHAAVTSMAVSIPELDGATKCAMFGLQYAHTLDMLDGQEQAKVIPVSFGSAGIFRGRSGWKIENDPEFVKTRLSGHVTPVAVAFIKPYYTFLFLHALFAMGEPSLTTFNTLSITLFSDFVRLIETHWEELLRAIETGQIPKLEGLDVLRPHIQAHFCPRPDRAEELQRLGVNMRAVGWLKQIWPNLTLVTGNTTGSFSAVLPWVRDCLGPSVSVRNVAYASSEAWLGTTYNPESGGNLYKAQTTEDVLEYLDIDQPENAEYITQAWDLQVGKKYEVILTTRDGFWRYRLGDVLEIAGFASEDGSPLVRFSERRNAVMRVSGEFVSEAELHRAIGSIKDIVGRVTDFSVVIDDRWFSQRYRFLLELEGELEPSEHSPLYLRTHCDAPSTGMPFLHERQDLGVGEPSVRILLTGTFGEYRPWRIGVSGGGSGQIEVPTIAYDPGVKDWLVGRVVQESGDGLRKI
ncbi:GH3 auxin-responsive promoter [Infundibulicybe gibba]|nr:GH3 auxin-responsive promoter [Infundibulicybe gibba]